MNLDIDRLEALAKAAPQGKWEIWTSYSWHRIYANQGSEKVRVIEPIVQRHDNHPDLMFGPGVEAWMEGFTPEVALALIAEVRALREDKARLDSGCIVTYERDEFGEENTCERRGNDLRAMIDAARKEKA
ncbi:MAG TPA: hypothetical protein VJ846_11570 [Sphingomicrobium sp.]|nr:hypothetical protein [Sphingomicrobium sp.]